MVLQPERVLSLCSGAGGLDLGVHGALGGRARTVCYVEHEVTACEVLAARIADGALDDAPIWTDLHTFDARLWRGRVDGIIGGYPCQPFSVAGKQLGAADPRHLWPRISAIVRDVQPTWCFFENVRGHVRIGLREVRADLRCMGYDVHAGIFSAAEVGAPHQRERLFILAHRESGHVGNATEWKRREDSSGGGGDLEYTHGARREGCERAGTPEQGAPARSATRESGGVGAFPPGPGDSAAWQRILREHPELAPAVEPALRGVADGLDAGMDLSRTARLRITGNGVVPAAAALAFRTLWGRLGDTHGSRSDALSQASRSREATGESGGQLAHAGYPKFEGGRDESRG